MRTYWPSQKMAKIQGHYLQLDHVERLFYSKRNHLCSPPTGLQLVKILKTFRHRLGTARALGQA